MSFSQEDAWFVDVYEHLKIKYDTCSFVGLSLPTLFHFQLPGNNGIRFQFCGFLINPVDRRIGFRLTNENYESICCPVNKTKDWIFCHSLTELIQTIEPVYLKLVKGG